MPFPILDLLPYVLAAISLAAGVWMFALLKVELRRGALRSRREREVLEGICGRLKISVEEIERKIEDRPAAVGETAAPPGPRPSLNMSHRAQVLRMSRRGERPATIAAALRLPLREVELLLKVHQAALAALA